MPSLEDATRLRLGSLFPLGAGPGLSVSVSALAAHRSHCSLLFRSLSRLCLRGMVEHERPRRALRTLSRGRFLTAGGRCG